MKFKLSQLMFILLCPFYLKGQTIIDSLLQELNGLEDEKKEAALLKELAIEYSFNDFEKSIEYGEKALAAAQKIDDKDLEAKVAFNLGRTNVIYSNNEKGLNWGKKAADLAIETNNEELLVDCYVVIGGAYSMFEQADKTFEYYFKARDLAKKIGDEKGLGTIYQNIGLIYYWDNEYPEALENFQEAIKIFEKIGHKRFLVKAYANAAMAVDNNDIALEYNLKALEIAKSNPDNQFAILFATEQLAEFYLLKQKNYEEALKLLWIAQKFARDFNYPGFIIKAEKRLGETHLALNNLDSAVHYLKLAKVHFDNENDVVFAAETDFLLSSAYEKKGNFKAAFQVLKEAAILKDTIYNNENKEAVAKAKTQLETEKKEAQIIQQKLQIAQQTNTRNKILIGGGLILFLLAFIFQRYYYHQKRKKQAAEAELLQEKKEAEKLRELDRLKSTFFTNISHELRTPLTLVAAPLADALQEVKPSPLKNHLELANSNTQKLLRLVNEILDLSKLEAGKIESKLAETHLLQTVRRIFYAFESIAQIRGLQLQFNTNIPKDLKVFLDVEKFEKILNNLMANAVKFTEKDGTISLNAKHENGQFFFEVIDTGMGISEEELPKVFDRFYQSTDEKASMQGGTGIGLSLAKELANLMKGDLKVESKIGEGSSFKLEIPLDLVDAEKPISDVPRQEEIVIEQNTVEAKPIYQPILFNGQKPKILIVEDNEEMSQYLAESLSKNYQITKAFDGLEALEKLEKESFDLITCDVMMPNLDGFSFREKLMKNEVWRQIPFVMLTARAMEADKLKGLRLGVDDYLTKPFNFNELEARLHNLLNNKIARENYKNEVEEIEEKPLSHDEQLIKTAEEFVLKKIDDTQLRVDDLAKALNLSSRHLSRTMTKIIGISPVNFILEIRLQKARQLLESRQFLTVSEVRYEIGIESASYFTKKFTVRFGKNPKTYLE